MAGKRERESGEHKCDAQKASKKKRGNFPKEATEILRKWASENRYSPFPTEAEKKMLQQKTNLTSAQINNWFINARRRYVVDVLRSEGEDPNIYKRSRKVSKTPEQVDTQGGNNVKRLDMSPEAKLQQPAVNGMLLLHQVDGLSEMIYTIPALATVTLIPTTGLQSINVAQSQLQNIHNGKPKAELSRASTSTSCDSDVPLNPLYMLSLVASSRYKKLLRSEAAKRAAETEEKKKKM